MHTMTASLRLVYPPISNQHADWLLGDAEARARLDASNLYMIGARREAEFHALNWDEKAGLMNFKIGFADQQITGFVDIGGIIRERSRCPSGHIDIRAGAKYIRIADVDGDERNPLAWFTPDKFLWDVWRRHDFVHLQGDGRQIATYDLLYIGMSQDSAFKRLVEAPHEARLKILTNELVRGAKGRLSEEIMFFFFDIDPLFVSTYGENDEIDDLAVAMMVDPSTRVPPRAVIEDAEKAFIKMLRTPYNKRRYKSYPSIANGLANGVLHRYGYSIAEDVIFTVGDMEMTGGYAEGLPCSNDADFIDIDGPTASFVDISKELLTELDGDASSSELLA